MTRVGPEHSRNPPTGGCCSTLGLSAREAFLPHQRAALRTALLPAIDSTKVVGLISLPGAMTGLILAGVDPLTAIRYPSSWPPSRTTSGYPYTRKSNSGSSTSSPTWTVKGGHALTMKLPQGCRPATVTWATVRPDRTTERRPPAWQAAPSGAKDLVFE
jgi:hypothetical protein